MDAIVLIGCAVAFLVSYKLLQKPCSHQRMSVDHYCWGCGKSLQNIMIERHHRSVKWRKER